MGAHRGVTPLETSTTTSFTTSSLSDPFPLVSHEQYATLERVVAALPLGARNWADFEETYKLLGVDEDEYYPLCLKLTFERGHDWREKWSTAKASLEERGVTFAADVQGRQAVEPSSSRKSARGFDLLKAKVDQVTTTAPSSRRPLPAAAPATTPRAAYPSRTRSTPHNDPTPRASRPTRPFLVETANGNSSSDDYVGVPSSAPRTTPRHRDEHTAPILPQAPAQRSPLLSTTATARREKHSSLPPLPSDSSPRLPTHTRTTSSHPLLSQRINSVTPVAPSAPFAPPPTPYSVALPTPLEQRAIAFRRVSLLSLSWYNWRQRLAFLRTRSENLDAARRVVLARWVVVWWREKLARVQQLESLVEKVVRERQGAVKRGAFAVWKGKVEERRRAEWEAGLRGAWEIVRGKWKEKARRECFQHWRQIALESRSNRFRRETLLGTALFRWRSKLARLVELEQQAASLLDQRQAQTQRGVLETWRDKADLLGAERRLVRRREDRTVWSCWEYWRWRTRQALEQRRLEELADHHFNDKQRRRWITTWRRQLQHTETLSLTADAYIRHRDRKTLQSHLTHWIVEWSGRLMLHSRSLGLLQTSLSTWRERHLRITIDLDARCVAFIEHTSRKVIEGCWDQWTASLEQKGEMRRVAEQVGERWTVARGMGRWRERVTEVEVKGRKADVARDFFAERGAWNRWLCRVAERKRARWVEERVRRRKREVLLFWLAKTRQVKADRAVVQSFHAAADSRIAADALRQWTRRIVDVRTREHDAKAMYEANLVRSSFTRWTDRIVAVGGLYDLADSFVVVKSEELQARAFRHWQAITRRKQEHRRRLQDFVAAKRRKLVEEAFGVWRERSLRKIEVVVVQMKERREKRELLGMWVEASEYLHAVRRHKEKRLRRLFDTWREFTPPLALALRGRDWEFEIVARRSFEIWRIRQQAQSALRAARRYHSANTTPNSSLTAAPTPSFRASLTLSSASGSGSGSHSSPSRSSFPSALTTSYTSPQAPRPAPAPAPSPSPFRSRLLSSSSSPASPRASPSSSTPPLGIGTGREFRGSRSVDGGSSEAGSGRSGGVEALRARLRAAAAAARAREGEGR